MENKNRILKRKKSQSPSSSPPNESTLHDKEIIKSNNNNNNNNNNNSSSGNNNSGNNSHSNNHSHHKKNDHKKKEKHHTNQSKLSNPKKYQKSNSSNTSNELIDHHQHVPSDLNNNQPLLSNTDPTSKNNEVSKNSKDDGLISKNNSSANNSTPLDSTNTVTTPTTPFNDIHIKASPSLSPAVTATPAPLPTVTTPSTPFTVTSSSPLPISNSIYIPKFKATSQPSQPSKPLSDNLDFIPISDSKNTAPNSHSTQPKPINASYNSNSSNHYKSKNNQHNSSSSGFIVPVWLEGIIKNERDLQSLTLEDEIEYFVEWIKPTDIENRLRQKIAKEVEGIIRGLWPNSNIVIFGSFSTNLSLPSSDIDIQVSNITSDTVNVNRYSYDPIRDLHHTLLRNHQNSFSNCRLISSAKVPIIKMTSINTHFNIDICFNTPNGIENTKIIKQLLSDYKSMRTLLLVIKFFLFQNSLNETYTGGIGSYALALMVVSFLQLRHVPLELRTEMANIKARKSYRHAGDDTDYGGMVLEFFELYGRSFNYSSLGISLEHGGFYFRKSDPVWGTSLTLLDPHDRENDVGKNSFNIPFIRGAFTNSLLKLISQDLLKEKYSGFKFTTILSRIIEERLTEQLARERNSVIKYGRYLDLQGSLPNQVPIDSLIVNPESKSQNSAKKNSTSSKHSTFISISDDDNDDSSSSEEESFKSKKKQTTMNKSANGKSPNTPIDKRDNEREELIIFSSSSDEKEDCIIISDESDLNNTATSNKSDLSDSNFSDYSSDEMESMIESNSNSPNQSNYSPLSSDNEDFLKPHQEKKQQTQNQLEQQRHLNEKQKDVFAW